LASYKNAIVGNVVTVVSQNTRIDDHSAKYAAKAAKAAKTKVANIAIVTT
jgi:hypothetical protein